MSISPTWRGRRLSIVLGLLACTLMFASPEVRAADTFRVVNVSPDDTLNVRAGPSVSFPVLGTLAREATGVEALGGCVEGWCPVRSGILLGWASARFLEAETPDAGSGTANVGTVLADGTLERTLPDGRRVRRLPNGNLQTVWPDGRVSVSTFVTAPGPDLPALPVAVSGWVGAVSADLFTILNNILSDDEMVAYRRTEEGKDTIQVLDWRLRSIAFLTTPSS